MTKHISLLDSYPKPDMTEVERLLEQALARSSKKIVVLDDDPTGVQTVHDISVYTNWTFESIRQGFQEENSLFYILTNSRGFTAAQTTQAHKEIAEVVHQASVETGKDYIFISRSDSTLRGHFPLETSILREAYERNTKKAIDGEILCPFFKEGGRFTIDDVHYVKYGDELVPASETEFAKDPTFGYSSSNLREYVEEKTHGEYLAKDVISIPLSLLRALDFEAIEGLLLQAENFEKIIVNAIDYDDLKVFCVALFSAFEKGKHFMFRTAAGIVKVMGGISSQPLLTREQMVTTGNTNGGIIVVGSHTDKTTRQLDQLRQLPDLDFVLLDVSHINDGEAFLHTVEDCIRQEEEALRNGRTVCVYTSRSLITAGTGNKEDELRLSIRISDAVQSLVGSLTVTPSFIIAKGGITSSDVGTKALRVTKANVLGQIRPGIPVWQTGPESKFPMTPYVIFPGNVGDDNTLREAVEILK